MFVQRELKFSTIKLNRTSTGYPKEVLVCRNCVMDLESAFLSVVN
jgi:hypothetical protein